MWTRMYKTSFFMMSDLSKFTKNEELSNFSYRVLEGKGIRLYCTPSWSNHFTWIQKVTDMNGKKLADKVYCETQLQDIIDHYGRS